jgi:hypothetical protein
MWEITPTWRPVLPLQSHRSPSEWPQAAAERGQAEAFCVTLFAFRPIAENQAILGHQLNGGRSQDKSSTAQALRNHRCAQWRDWLLA